MADGFESIQEGFRDLRSGYHEGTQAAYAAEDRQIAAEQRQRQLDAQMEMADNIGDKPNIWRVPVETIQSALRGGYDITKMEGLMKKEFAPPSPFESANAHLITDLTGLTKQIMSETDPEKKRSLMGQMGANLTMQGKFQYADANGKPMGFFNFLNDTAQDAVYSSAKDFVKEKSGLELGKDHPLNDVKSFVDQQHLFKSMAQEQASLPLEDQPVYAAMLRRVNQMNMKEAADTYNSGIMKLTGTDGNTSKFPVYASIKDLLGYKAMSEGVNDTMVKAGAITPDVYNLIRAKQADAMNFSKFKGGGRGPVLNIFDVVGGQPKTSNVSKRSKSVGELLSSSPRLSDRLAAKAGKSVSDFVGKAPSAIAGAASSAYKTLQHGLNVPDDEEAAALEKAKRLRAGD